MPNLLHLDAIQRRDGRKYADKKLTGAEAILFNDYIGHNPHASVLIVAILKCLFVFDSLAVLTGIHADLNEHMHQSMMCQHHIYIYTYKEI